MEHQPNDLADQFDPREMDLEKLAKLTDDFVLMIAYNLWSDSVCRHLDEKGELRFAVVRVCIAFIEMMRIRAERQTEHKSIVDYLNSLL